ncbi:MFS transporter [Thermodesulfobacteriota bacterium]
MEKIPILLIALGHVWVDASQGILPVALTKFKELFALNYFQIGVVMMVLNLTSSVIQPVFGFISDRKPIGWFVPVGILWTVIAMGLLGWAPTYFFVLLIVGLSGLGTAAFHPRAMKAIYFVSGLRKGFGAAIFSTGGNVGFALGPIVGSFLILGFGLHATLWLFFPGLLLFLAILFYPGDFLRRESISQDNSESSVEGDSHPILWISLIAACLVVIVRSWVYVSFITYLPMFLQDQGINLKAGSTMLTVFLAGGAAAGLFGGHLSDRVGRRSVIAISNLLYVPIMSLLILSSGPWLWVFAVLSGATLLASFSVTVVVAQELLPRHVGLASGLILGLSFGTGGLGTAFSGYLADIFGLYNTVWILTFAPLLAVVLAVFIKVTPGGVSHAVTQP